jgi:chromatin segregation and condensation protein Rec8/ScpA/Scc1 (kleisin family)
MASEIILDRQDNGVHRFAKPPSFVEPPINDFSLKGLDMDKLNNAFKEVLKRKNFTANAPTKKDFNKVMERHRTSILSKVKKLLHALTDESQISWFDYFDEMNDRMEIVAGFLAILELLKLNKIEIITNGEIMHLKRI